MPNVFPRKSLHGRDFSRMLFVCGGVAGFAPERYIAADGPRPRIHLNSACFLSSRALKGRGNAVFRIRYQLVFFIRHQRACLTPEMVRHLHRLFEDGARQWRCDLVEFAGEVDHVRIVIDAHPALVLSRMVGNLKTVTARRMRAEYRDYLEPYFRGPHFWSRSYAVSSIEAGVSADVLVDRAREHEAESTY